MARSNWILEISEIGIGDSDGDDYGPFSQAAAEELSNWFNEYLGGPRDDGMNFYAHCWPLNKTSKTQLRENYAP